MDHLHQISKFALFVRSINIQINNKKYIYTGCNRKRAFILTGNLLQLF
jgi:hypothetical protein